MPVHVAAATALFVTITAGYLLLAVFFPVMYVFATYEDLFGEWSQTFFFLAAFLFSLRMSFMPSRYRWFFRVLALACFYTVMEEISWGQRIIGFDTPAWLERYNLQHEANVHNLLVGPVDTPLKDAIEYLMAAAFIGYGLAYPAMIAARVRVALWFDRMGLAAPPLYLWPYFVTAAVLEIGLLNFNEAEVAELLIGAAMAILSAHYWFAEDRGLDVHGAPRWNAAQAGRFAMIAAGIAAGVAASAAATTYIFYHDPVKRARIDGRLFNGYEKFARRYAAYDRWDVAADFYRRVHEREPDRTSILRRLATAHRNMGDEAGFRKYTLEALEISLHKYAENPNKISTNLALARTYKQLGEHGKAGYHAVRANQIALKRARAEPGSAHWAYWLAKTYREIGNYRAALEQYEKAFRLNPSSTKYRKRYYEMKRIVEGS